jgi:capsular exopolysaccharide synthesis family protein
MDLPEYLEKREDKDQALYEVVRDTPTTLYEYGRLLLRRKGVLFIAAVFGTSVGLLISMPRTRIFQAHTMLEIQRLNENLLNTGEISPTANSATAVEEMQTQIRLLQSESLIGHVIGKFGINHSFIPPTRLERWRAALGFSSSAVAVSSRETAVMMAAGTISIEPLQQARVIQISCDSTDPKIAAEFLNILVNEFIDQKMSSRVETSQRTSQWLNRQVDELKLNLEKSEENLQSFGLSAGLMFTSEKDSSVSEQKLQQLQSELSKAQAERVTKQSKYEIASSSPAESLPEVLDDASLRNIQLKLADLRGQLAELNVSLTPEHYRIQKLQAQIDELRDDFNRERADIIKRIANEYEDAKRREELFSRAYAAQSTLVSDQSDKIAHYGILKREAETNRQLYEAMMQRVKEYAIASAVTANNVHVVDPALPPGAPYKPDIYMYTMLGLATGVFLGIMLIIQREHADRTLSSPGEVSSCLKIPEFGVILTAHVDRTLTGESVNGKQTASRRLQTPSKESPRAIELVAWNRPSSLFAECFRTVATSLLFTESNGKSPQVLVITSSNPQDGKSTTASNLAVALAETKRRVLVIDADLRRPHLHHIFQLENRWGLIDVLQSEIEIGDYPLDMLVQETVVPRVFALSSGTKGESIVHALHSARLPELLKRFRTEFDIVIVDAPPVARMADARVLARLADGVVLIIRSGRTTRDMAKDACRQFAEDRTPVIGTILNMWDPKGSNQEAYTHYYDSYYEYYA